MPPQASAQRMKISLVFTLWSWVKTYTIFLGKNLNECSGSRSNQFLDFCYCIEAGIVIIFPFLLACFFFGAFEYFLSALGSTLLF